VEIEEVEPEPGDPRDAAPEAKTEAGDKGGAETDDRHLPLVGVAERP
jgi:hypothetical protein